MRIEHGSLQGKNRIFIAEVDDFKTMDKVVLDYINSIHFKSYYQRLTFDPNGWWIDYGSYVDFIYITDLPVNAYNLYMEERADANNTSGKDV